MMGSPLGNFCQLEHSRDIYVSALTNLGGKKWNFHTFCQFGIVIYSNSIYSITCVTDVKSKYVTFFNSQTNLWQFPEAEMKSWQVRGQRSIQHMLPFCAENGGRARPISKLASESYEPWQWCQDSVRGKAQIGLSTVKFWWKFEVCNTHNFHGEMVQSKKWTTFSN